ncbi:MAG: translation elongation factor Ts [Candidatus Niyogibacteria bacterium RIFCSPLOWO2_01_FULL_45_48]|uniref:Elongation factor Ts n=2 Tax=Candidatus Niyogiibacteriota TaxID=1817912 RepID=A0A1G2F157_9BACT|nr:MAG: translation elongation factor Ts [Candidatus Niyogibacteria bacterium RIFCSPLOWO2_01_FULL_45_48]OGZ30346.1 MAG: translation elongation factor Ts [Candidatus Niyogibacteria bacterium RIFCSPHIGHO2_01_FULL_45_28]OGZ31667.1 MAG: translation elongation factor Ts [Candidatus Niyogibacteria bacterium RIFCSPLOWO2_02_FULL_45_13]
METIKKLRSICGASMTDCKRALVEAGDDLGKALEILKERGAEIAEKKASRETKAGVVDVYLHSDRKLGAIVELRTETDFVARTDEFKALAHDLAMQIAAEGAENTEELLVQPFIKDQSKTVGDCIKEATAKFGEKIEVAKFYRINL